MATAYTSLLGFALPVTGELDGTWGTTVNNSITELVEDSIAATATASVASGDWTLSTTGSGAANEARCAILIPTGSPGVSRNIIAPAQSKAYVVINQSDAAVVVKGSATTGTTIAAGDKAIVAWNGSDFVTIASAATDGVSTISFGTTGLTPSTATSGAVSVAGTLAVANGGTGQTSYTNGQLLIGNTTGNTLTKATLTAGSGISITNGTGSITIAATGGGGTVTSVSGTGTVNGITLTGTVTTSGSLTLGGTLSGVSLTSQVSGILPVANGGTNNAFFTVSGPASSAKTYTFPNENMSVGYRNIPAVGTKTGSYTLAVADVGKYVQVGSGGSITIPNATFAEGDVVSIFNNTTGNITITCTITTAYIAGTDSDKASVTLATRGVATILFISSTVCVISGNVT